MPMVTECELVSPYGVREYAYIKSYTSRGGSNFVGDNCGLKIQRRLPDLVVATYYYLCWNSLF